MKRTIFIGLVLWTAITALIIPNGFAANMFIDDFNTHKGWSGYEPGGWERGLAHAGTPEFGNPGPETDHTPTEDNYILGFAIGGEGYPNDLLEKNIISPPIDCTGQDWVFL